MKIKQLDIAGFRSLKNVSWQPGDLNVVIGQNGTGKSNLLRMLELIAASAQGQLSKYIQVSGGMTAIRWDGVAKIVSFTLRTNTFDEEHFDYEDSYELAVGGNTEPDIREEKWNWRHTSPDREEEEKESIIERGYVKTVYLGQAINSTQKISRQETLLSLFNQLTATPRVRTHIETKDFRQQLAELRVYQDLNVGQDSKIRQAVVASYEKQVESNGQNLVQVLHTLYAEDREFKRNIDLAMRAAFGSDYEELVFPPAADQRVQLRVRWKTLKRAQSAADLSDGTLRFLLLMTVLNAPDPPMLIAIDEPETGLHPSMLPIIAEFAVEASSRTQIVFTTHSPQFLDAFTDIKPTTTVAKWENGETSLQVLDDEELGYWLREYSLGELFRAGDLEAIA